MFLPDSVNMNNIGLSDRILETPPQSSTKCPPQMSCRQSIHLEADSRRNCFLWAAHTQQIRVPIHCSRAAEVWQRRRNAPETRIEMRRDIKTNSSGRRLIGQEGVGIERCRFERH